MADESVRVLDEGDKSTIEVVDSTTGELITLRDGDQLPMRYEANGALERDAKADAVIAFAKRTKDWPLLEEVVSRDVV